MVYFTYLLGKAFLCFVFEIDKVRGIKKNLRFD